MQVRPHVNYFYFAVFFVILSFTHVFQVFLIEGVEQQERFFYVIYSLGQCFLETGILILASQILKNRFSWKINRIFVIAMFIILLIHTVDFPLVRIMDMTVWYALDFVLAENWANFVEMLKASNVSLVSWVIAGLIACLVPLVGVLLFKIADRASRKRPIYLSNRALSISLFSVALVLTTLDYNIGVANNEKLLKALPWKGTLFSESLPTVILDRSLAKKSPEQDYLAELENSSLEVVVKPNIYLFIVESLREDFLTPGIAPYLTDFREESGKFNRSISAANATQFSWFSIYHAVHAFQWGNRQHWEKGSLPLQILKKIGYQIHVLSAARLVYYNMEERILGKDHQLADTYQIFDNFEANHEKDTATIQALLQNKETEGHVFLVFLDSTHFDYSYPKEAAIMIAPSGIDYFGVACRNGIAGVRQRYCNAVHFIDSLLGQFFNQVDSKAVVVVTGDHGEEFLEQENIFHASNLSMMQTRVPIYCKLGQTVPHPQELAAHVDIFPTILHHVLGENLFGHWFDGESLLEPRKNNFTISARYNASRPPFEFLIYNGQHQLIGRFDQEKDIFQSKSLHLVSLKDESNQSLIIHPQSVKDEFEGAMDQLFR
jgi:hypothetical protein